MTLALSLGARALTLDGFEDYLEVGSGTANFTLYQTNTALAVFPLAATPFGAGNSDAIVLASTPISSTGTEVAGKGNRFVITNQNGDTALSGTVGAIGSGADIETPALTVTAAATQTLNALVVRMASTGELSVEGSLTLV
jgi:hypothetical protein